MRFIYKLFLNHFTQLALYISSVLLLLLSLISYNSFDPSLNTASDSLVSNFCGTIGAITADFLIQNFGLAAFFLVIIISLWSWHLFAKHKFTLSFSVRVILSLLALIFFSITFSLIKTSNLPAGNGGAIGILLMPLIGKILGPVWPLATLLLGIICFIKAIDYELKPILLGLINNLRTKPVEVALPSNDHTPAVPTPSALENISHPQNVDLPASNYKPASPKERVGLAAINQVSSNYQLPYVDLLGHVNNQNVTLESYEQLQENARSLLKVLNDFGVKGKILEIHQGPVVTLYEFEPSAGTKSSRVIGLADDIARSLSAISTRIAVISGRNALGVEIPNKDREFFSLRELLETKEYNNPTLNLPIILGKDLEGKPAVVDLAKMPHLLVAGTTGSGKSVAINAMIVSLLYRHTPETCKFIMIDPKMLELSVYQDIPHLLTPVVTEPGKAVVALKWAVKEMENRYRLMSNLAVRNITGYNEKIIEARTAGKQLERTAQVGFDPETGKPIYESVAIDMEPMPFIVVIVDEMADLMLVAGKDIETSIQRLAQMARAAGIHIIMATQRPSVDVITGVIKANFPSRVSFKVTSKIDSRTILGEQGAEQLLGMGDMLYVGSSGGVARLHGPFVKDTEVEKIASFLKAQGAPQYLTNVTENEDEIGEVAIDNEGDDDSLYRQALQIVKRDRKVSTSYVQRCLRIGYNRAALIIERMERDGVVSPPNHSGKREILLDED